MQTPNRPLLLVDVKKEGTISGRTAEKGGFDILGTGVAGRLQPDLYHHGLNSQIAVCALEPVGTCRKCTICAQHRPTKSWLACFRPHRAFLEHSWFKPTRKGRKHRGPYFFCGYLHHWLWYYWYICGLSSRQKLRGEDTCIHRDLGSEGFL